MAAERAYARLKADLCKGRYAPEMILNVHLIASEIGVSISPVRDAMERLVGERLVVLRPEGGFQIPLMTEDCAADLYRWHAILVSLALPARIPAWRNPALALELGAIEDDDAIAIATAAARIFGEIGGWSGSGHLQVAIDAAADRLASLRVRETMIVGRRSELADIGALTETGDHRRLRNAIRRYHRRRERHVDAIVAALYRRR